MKSNLKLTAVFISLAFIVISCGKTSKEGKMIPNNAMAVMHLNTKSLSSKLSWNEIAVSSYQTHFVIHHAEDLTLSKCCVFSIHWNAVVLQTLLKEIIKRPVRARKPSWL